MAKKITLYSLFAAFALICSYIEHLIPLSFIAPGIKPGLANCAAILLLLYFNDTKGAFLVNTVRILLGTLLFSPASTLLFSLTAGTVSLCASCLLNKSKTFSIFGTCICAAVIHNLVQLLVAFFITSTVGILYYLPILILCGIISGFLCGIISRLLIKFIPKKYL